MYHAFIKALKSREISFHNRLHIFLAAGGGIALYVISPITYIFMGYNTAIAAFLIFSGLVLHGSLIFSIKTGRYGDGAIISALYIAMIFAPADMLYAGGVFAGPPTWGVLFFIFAWLSLSPLARAWVMPFMVIIYAACFYASYVNPDLIREMSRKGSYIDSFIALIGVSAFACAMFTLSHRMTSREKAIVEAQRDEIEKLNDSQNSFFSAMSHEIRTPINAILGFNEMTLRSDPPEDIAANAENIQGAGKMLLTLINDILDLSKLQSGSMSITPTDYDTSVMLADIISMINSMAARKGLRFNVRIGESIPSKLKGDDTRLKQILVNILNNAIKYTDDGSITFSINADIYDEGVAVMNFEVTDTGIGIKKEDIPTLFSVFWRIDEVRNRRIEGTGLGLSIVKNLLDLMGGTISVNSIYTKGSTFHISVPQTVTDASPMRDIDLAVSASSVRSGELSGSTKRSAGFEAPGASILIVDDNAMNRQVAKGLLHSTKMRADTAESGTECLELTLRGAYDIILMDHFMPDMDGVETLMKIRSQEGGLCRDTPVIALTANVGSDSEQYYLKHGFDGYLSKPIIPRMLEHAVLKFLPPDRVIRKEETADAPSPIRVHERRKKQRIMITTESISDLSQDNAKPFGIVVMPFYIRLGADAGEHAQRAGNTLEDGTRFMDGVEIDALSLEKSGCMRQAVTEIPQYEEYVEFFAEQLTKADRIIHLTMAKHDKLNAWARATDAAAAFGSVDVVDSGFSSAGQGCLAVMAAKKLREGADRDELLEFIEEAKRTIDMSFIFGRRQAEHAGEARRENRSAGRQSDSSKNNRPSLTDTTPENPFSGLHSALMLRSVCTYKNSRTVIRGISVGRLSTARTDYVRRTLARRDISDDILIIVYSGLSDDELNEVIETVHTCRSFKRIEVQRSSASVLCGCGVGSISLVYLRTPVRK